MEPKTDSNEQSLRFLQLRFIGKLLAGFTHEIKNHLAIVKESAGLMDDMIKMGNSGINDPAQYLEIIHSIEEQVEKSIEHFLYLNHFSHRMDTPMSTFSVNECLEELIALMKRFAAQKRVSLESELRSDIKPIYNCPALLQFIVFNLLEEKLSAIEDRGRIIVRTEIDNGSVFIMIIPEGAMKKNDDKNLCPPEIYDFVIKKLNGTIKEDGETAVIALPATGDS